MSCGAIPITSRLTPSVLSTLTEGFDLGPAQALTTDTVLQQPSELINWLEKHWTPSVIAAHYQAESAELQKRRVAMKAFAQTTYTWKHSAELLRELF